MSGHRTFPSSGPARALVAAAALVLLLLVSLVGARAEAAPQKQDRSEAAPPCKAGQRSTKKKPCRKKCALGQRSTRAKPCIKLTGLEEARLTVAAHRKPLKWTAPGPAFSVARARGKTAYYIAASSNVPVVTYWRETAERVLKEYGVEFVWFNAGGATSRFIQGIEQAIAVKADVIFLQAIDPNFLLPQLNRAKRAGIPVVLALGGLPSIPTLPAAVADVTRNYYREGRLLAAWITADSKARAKVLGFGTADVPNVRHWARGLVDGINRFCPRSCEVDVDYAPFSEFATRLPTLTRTAIQSDPNLNYLVPAYDGFSFLVVPSVNSSGAKDRVKVISADATPAVLELIKRGPPMVMDLGVPNEQHAYAQVDAILRALTGQRPVRDYKEGFRFFELRDVMRMDTTTSENARAWYGVSYATEFRKLWRR